MDSPPVPLLKESSVVTVEFPEKDESMGEVLVAFLGPDCQDPVSATAIEVASMYLAGSSVSVLESSMVEIENPWASSARIYTEDRPNTVLWIELTAVPTEKLGPAEEKLGEILRKTVHEPLNFAYLTDLIRRNKLQTQFYTETSGYSFSARVVIDHVFGKRDGSQLRENLESLKVYDELEKWDDKTWRDFMRKWLVDNHHVSILGRPSAKMVKKIEEDEKQRVADRVKRLGAEGLKKLQDKLDAAKAENDKEIPSAIVGQFPVPNVDSIHFIKTTTARAGLALKDGKL